MKICGLITLVIGIVGLAEIIATPGSQLLASFACGWCIGIGIGMATK